MTICVRKDFKTIGEAVAAAKDGDTIVVSSGIYREKVYIKQKNLTLLGDGHVTITYDAGSGNPRPDGELYDTFTSATVTVEASAENFRAENIIFENNYNRENPDISVTQALAMSCGADAYFENCSFLGWQDTLYVNGKTKQYFKNCYIEGSVDFVFGDAGAVFDECHINCVRTGSYISAANTDKSSEYGLVFYKCNITANRGCDGIYLGRPWRAEYENVRSHTAFIECVYDFDDKPCGWLRWHAPEGMELDRIRYEEYGNTRPDGSTVSTAERAPFSREISREEAAELCKKCLRKS